jgi:hypothetical protein
VLRGGIEQLDWLPNGIDPLDHPVRKLRAHTAALRAVIHFELHPLNGVLLLRGKPAPPGREGIHHEVAGLGGTAEGHLELGGVFIDNPTRNILFRTPKVMVTRFVIPPRLSSARERPKLDRGFAIHAQAFAPGGGLVGLVFFLRLNWLQVYEVAKVQ